MTSINACTSHRCLLESIIECLAGFDIILVLSPLRGLTFDSATDVPPSLSAELRLALATNVMFLHRRGERCSAGVLLCSGALHWSCSEGGDGRGEGGEDIETDGDSRVEWTYKETEKKQGIKLQIKQKQTRRPKKRRSFITGKRERELGRRNIGDNLKSTQHDTNQHEPTARDGEDVV